MLGKIAQSAANALVLPAVLAWGLSGFVSPVHGQSLPPIDVFVYLDQSGTVIGGGEQDDPWFAIARQVDALLTLDIGGQPIITDNSRIALYGFGDGVEVLASDRGFNLGEVRNILLGYGSGLGSDIVTDFEPVFEGIAADITSPIGTNSRIQINVIASDFIHDPINNSIVICEDNTAFTRRTEIEARQREIQAELDRDETTPERNTELRIEQTALLDEITLLDEQGRPRFRQMIADLTEEIERGREIGRQAMLVLLDVDASDRLSGSANYRLCVSEALAVDPLGTMLVEEVAALQVPVPLEDDPDFRPFLTALEDRILEISNVDVQIRDARGRAEQGAYRVDLDVLNIGFGAVEIQAVEIGQADAAYRSTDSAGIEILPAELIGNVPITLTERVLDPQRAERFYREESVPVRLLVRRGDQDVVIEGTIDNAAAPQLSVGSPLLRQIGVDQFRLAGTVMLPSEGSVQRIVLVNSFTSEELSVPLRQPPPVTWQGADLAATTAALSQNDLGSIGFVTGPTPPPLALWIQYRTADGVFEDSIGGLAVELGRAIQIEQVTLVEERPGSDQIVLEIGVINRGDREERLRQAVFTSGLVPSDYEHPFPDGTRVLPFDQVRRPSLFRIAVPSAFAEAVERGELRVNLITEGFESVPAMFTGAVDTSLAVPTARLECLPFLFSQVAWSVADDDQLRLRIPIRNPSAVRQVINRVSLAADGNLDRIIGRHTPTGGANQIIGPDAEGEVEILIPTAEMLSLVTDGITSVTVLVESEQTGACRQARNVPLFRFAPVRAENLRWDLGDDGASALAFDLINPDGVTNLVRGIHQQVGLDGAVDRARLISQEYPVEIPPNSSVQVRIPVGADTIRAILRPGVDFYIRVEDSNRDENAPIRVSDPGFSITFTQLSTPTWLDPPRNVIRVTLNTRGEPDIEPVAVYLANDRTGAGPVREAGFDLREVAREDDRIVIDIPFTSALQENYLLTDGTFVCVISNFAPNLNRDQCADTGAWTALPPPLAPEPLSLIIDSIDVRARGGRLILSFSVKNSGPLVNQLRGAWLSSSPAGENAQLFRGDDAAADWAVTVPPNGGQAEVELILERQRTEALYRNYVAYLVIRDMSDAAVNAETAFGSTEAVPVDLVQLDLRFAGPPQRAHGENLVLWLWESAQRLVGVGRGEQQQYWAPPEIRGNVLIERSLPWELEDYRLEIYFEAPVIGAEPDRLPSQALGLQAGFPPGGLVQDYSFAFKNTEVSSLGDRLDEGTPIVAQLFAPIGRTRIDVASARSFIIYSMLGTSLYWAVVILFGLYAIILFINWIVFNVGDDGPRGSMRGTARNFAWIDQIVVGNKIMPLDYKGVYYATASVQVLIIGIFLSILGDTASRFFTWASIGVVLLIGATFAYLFFLKIWIYWKIRRAPHKSISELMASFRRFTQNIKILGSIVITIIAFMFAILSEIGVDIMYPRDAIEYTRAED